MQHADRTPSDDSSNYLRVVPDVPHDRRPYRELVPADERERIQSLSRPDLEDMAFLLVGQVALWRGQAERRRSSKVRRRVPAEVWDEPIDTVLKALERAGCSWKPSGVNRWRAQCPAHDGGDLNLSVDESNGMNAEEGVIGLRCFVGCDTDSVLRALGLGWSDLFPRHDRKAA